MTYPNVQPQPSFPAVERDVLAFWDTDGTFQAGARVEVGFDAGMRFYVSDKALSGAFLAVQGSVFYFSAASTVLVGPGAMFGYAFRPKDTLLITVGAGVQAWYQPTKDSGARVLGVQPNMDVILLPGFQRPGTGKWGPQPMIRFTVGPTF